MLYYISEHCYYTINSVILFIDLIFTYSNDKPTYYLILNDYIKYDKTTLTTLLHNIK